MTIYDEIREALQREWRSGVTQQAIADRANLTNQHINNLLSGKRKVESMKLETLFKLFPQAAINLTGAQLAGDNAIQIQGGVAVAPDAAIVNKILEDETLTAEEKIKMLRVLKK
ncbi:helix-turn-helix transcriptional regulator [Victivallis sp. Marseille-Q1083]|uniref:helix-turn-helix domain-containing protein n=1 Tax=Victivallis sp. Marseille-Q1083 TaxID=2717288 RepID=UPI00158E78D8|nr:helix-turn-helix transcriptional regulator [Victivallis sp. Marseille-Q1083]